MIQKNNITKIQKYILMLISISCLFSFAQCESSSSGSNIPPVNETPTCPQGQIKIASGQCVTNNCEATQIFNASGVCETCPSGQVAINNACISPSSMCGGSVGINGSSVVIYKWITTGGAGSALSYTNANVELPNSRLLAVFVKGCKGGAVGSVQQDLTTVKSASLSYRDLYTGKMIPVSNTSNITQTPAIGLTTYRAPSLSANEAFFIMELRDVSNNIVAQILPFQSLFTSQQNYFQNCSSNTQYVSANLTLSYNSVTGDGGSGNGTPPDYSNNYFTCLDFSTPSSVTEAAFPNVGRAEMNKLLQAAGKMYTIH